jgi:hypothetical protein
LIGGIEMLIEAKRSFISVKLGNVSAGDVVETDEKYGKHLMEHGLAVEVTAGPSLFRDAGEPSFPLPVGADQPGSSSQAGQVSPEKIASASGVGAKKVTYRKRAVLQS